MKQLTILLLSTIIISYTNAQESNVTTTAAPFLRIATDAQAGGMAGIGMATTPTVASAFWNPAKVPFNKEKGGIAANYIPWLRDLSNDMYLASLGGNHKLNDNQAIHGSFRYFNMGDLQFTDENGTHLQQFQAREWTAEAGYSRKLSAKSGLGITVRYIHSNLANNGAGGEGYKAANGFSADLGYYYTGVNTGGSGWSFGAALTNLGGKLQKNFIPANLGIGAAYTKVISEQHTITFGLDINKLLVSAAPADAAELQTYRNRSVISSWFKSFDSGVSDLQIGAGAEYWYHSQFGLRAGYSWEDKNHGNRKYFTAGAGVKYNIVTLNFAYLFTTGSTQNPLNNTFMFGVNIDILK